MLTRRAPLDTKKVSAYRLPVGSQSHRRPTPAVMTTMPHLPGAMPCQAAYCRPYGRLQSASILSTLLASAAPTLTLTRIGKCCGSGKC